MKELVMIIPVRLIDFSSRDELTALKYLTQGLRHPKTMDQPCLGTALPFALGVSPLQGKPNREH
jgi:hypothetical protein